MVPHLYLRRIAAPAPVTGGIWRTAAAGVAGARGRPRAAEESLPRLAMVGAKRLVENRPRASACVPAPGAAAGSIPDRGGGQPGGRNPARGTPQWSVAAERGAVEPVRRRCH